MAQKGQKSKMDKRAKRAKSAFFKRNYSGMNAKLAKNLQGLIFFKIVPNLPVPPVIKILFFIINI